MIAPPTSLAHRRGQAWEQLALPALSRGSALLLCPGNLAPLARRGNVVWVHDLAPLLGDWYAEVYGRWHRAVVPRVARAASALITGSDTVKNEIVERLGVPPAKIEVVPPGVDERFSPEVDPAPVRARLSLDRPYVLAVGTDTRRKNFALLNLVAGTLAAEGIDVVLAGSSRHYMPPGSYAVRRLGYVPEADLAGLYAGAAALAFPSLYEGFGLPCLEAMACGTPVVASNRGALPETCGDAALLVDPNDAEAFAQALLEAVGPRAADLRAAGLDRAAGFGWDRTAEGVDRLMTVLLARSA